MSSIDHHMGVSPHRLPMHHHHSHVLQNTTPRTHYDLFVAYMQRLSCSTHLAKYHSEEAVEQQQRAGAVKVEATQGVLVKQDHGRGGQDVR